ncbi:hypothetical protein H0H92_011492 [Tricholoma furcatifolium]|nr:hypothetical protein H0H92_011492 [Tricholoma furcatifolium]
MSTPNDTAKSADPPTDADGANARPLEPQPKSEKEENKADDIEFVNEDGPYDYNDGVAFVEYDDDPYERKIARSIRAYEAERDEALRYMENEREQQRAEGDYSEGENKYFDEAKARGYESEEPEDFDSYPVMPHKR